MEDLPLLVSHFVGEFRALTGKPIREVSQEAMRCLMEYSWPGNVRELRSAIEYSVIHCRLREIGVEDLPPEINDLEQDRVAVLLDSKSPNQDSRQRLETALKKADGNRALAARLLGIGRATLYRHMADLGIPGDRKKG